MIVISSVSPLRRIEKEIDKMVKPKKIRMVRGRIINAKVDVCRLMEGLGNGNNRWI